MKKKIIIVILSITTLILTAITPLAFTVTTLLPDNLSSVPFQYMALRAYDGNNNLQWLNLADQRIARNNSAQNLDYTEYTEMYMPYEENPIIGRYNVFANSNYATMRFRVLEKTHRTNIFSPSAYVHFTLEDIGVTPPQSIKRDFYVQLITYNNTNAIRYAELKYDVTTVNNLTGQIYTYRSSNTLEPSLQYYEGIGYQEMIKASFPTSSNNNTLYSNITLKVYYQNDLQEIVVSSPSMYTALRNEERNTASIGIGQLNGSFQSATVPTNWFAWVVNGVNGFMELQILPNVTLWTIFYSMVGLTLFIFIMKKFAGG